MLQFIGYDVAMATLDKIKISVFSLIGKKGKPRRKATSLDAWLSPGEI